MSVCLLESGWQGTGYWACWENCHKGCLIAPNQYWIYNILYSAMGTRIPVGEPSTSPRFPRRYMGEITGIIPVEISSWFPCENSENEWEFSRRILSPPFPVESLGMFPFGNFPCFYPQNLKMQYNDIGRVPVMSKISQWWFDVILWWIKIFTGLGKLPSHFKLDLKTSPKFPREFSFYLQPKFPRGFPPPTTTISGDSQFNPRDVASLDVTHCQNLWVGITAKGTARNHSNSMGTVQLNCALLFWV